MNFGQEAMILTGKEIGFGQKRIWGAGGEFQNLVGQNCLSPPSRRTAWSGSWSSLIGKGLIIMSVYISLSQDDSKILNLYES